MPAQHPTSWCEKLPQKSDGRPLNTSHTSGKGRTAAESTTASCRQSSLGCWRYYKRGVATTHIESETLSRATRTSDARRPVGCITLRIRRADLHAWRRAIDHAQSHIVLHARARRANCELPRALARRVWETRCARRLSAQRQIRRALRIACARDAAAVFGSVGNATLNSVWRSRSRALRKR